MKLKITILTLAVLYHPLVLAQQSFNFNDSPNNFQNSLSNFDNSPNNFRNSPNNFENSPNNFSATNGVYDNRGNRIGYEVQAPSGVTNIYSNDGQRMGYIPAQRR